MAEYIPPRSIFGSQSAAVDRYTKRQEAEDAARQARALELLQAQIAQQAKLAEVSAAAQRKLEKDKLADQDTRETEGLTAVEMERLERAQMEGKLPPLPEGETLGNMARTSAARQQMIRRAAPAVAPMETALGATTVYGRGAEIADKKADAGLAGLEADIAAKAWEQNNPALANPTFGRLASTMLAAENSLARFGSPEYAEKLAAETEAKRAQAELDRAKAADTGGGGTADFLKSAAKAPNEVSTKTAQQDGTGTISNLPVIDRKTGKLVPTGGNFQQETINIAPTNTVSPRRIGGVRDDSFYDLVKKLLVEQK